jgi:hypothetical protein
VFLDRITPLLLTCMGSEYNPHAVRALLNLEVDLQRVKTESVDGSAPEVKYHDYLKLNKRTSKELAVGEGCTKGTTDYDNDLYSMPFNAVMHAGKFASD